MEAPLKLHVWSSECLELLSNVFGQLINNDRSERLACREKKETFIQRELKVTLQNVASYIYNRFSILLASEI